MKWIRRCRRLVAVPPAPVRGAFQRQTIAWRKSAVLVRVFYVLLLFVAVQQMPSWSGLSQRPDTAPLWPVAWLRWIDFSGGAYAIQIFFLAAALLAAARPECRLFRLGAFLGIFEFVALNNSFGKIGHSQHLLILTAFTLLLLPANWHTGKTRLVRQQTLLAFWGVQAVILLTYSMAGLGKILLAFYQMAHGEVHAFAPASLALHIANRLLETNATSLLGPWFINHPWAGWPGMLGVLYLQFFALVAAFRPVLHKAWALGLILFHLISFLTLTIAFPVNIALLALFFFCSPFAPESGAVRALPDALPLLAGIRRRQRARRSH